MDRVGIKSRTRDPKLNSVLENYRSKINEVIDELNLGTKWNDILDKPGFTFTGLTDTPASYSGKELQVVRVNEEETALEFTDILREKNTSCLFVGKTGATSIADIANTTIGYQAGNLLGNNVGCQDNVAIGYRAGYVMQSDGGSNKAVRNTLIGGEAGLDLTYGTDNILIGYRVGYNITTGSYNIAIGDRALYSNTIGDGHICIGRYAGEDISTGIGDLCLGYSAGRNISDGDYNVCIGTNAGFSLTTQDRNTFVGYDAGNPNLGSDGVAIGYRALYSSAVANQNVCIGKEAGYKMQGGGNVAIGYQTSYYNTETGTFNVQIGWRAGSRFTSADSCVVIGAQAGIQITTGDDNVILGYMAGYSLTTGGLNVMLGYKAGYNETGSNKLYIANSDTDNPLIYGEFDNSLLRIGGTLELTGTSITFPDADFQIKKGAEDIFFAGSNTYVRTPSGEIRLRIGGSDKLVVDSTYIRNKVDLYLDKASPSVRWLSGDVTFQTDESENTHTNVFIKGKGTGRGILGLFDEDNNEYLQAFSSNGYGYFRTMGTSPQALLLQNVTPKDITCWSGLSSGNPYFYWYGYKTGVGLKYGRIRVTSGGSFIFENSSGENMVFSASNRFTLRAGGSPNELEIESGFVKLLDNVALRYGSDSDMCMGYLSTGDIWHLCDGANLGSNIRMSINATGLSFFGANCVARQAHIGDASEMYDLTGTDTVDQSQLEASLSDLGSKINDILHALENYGLLATS